MGQEIKKLWEELKFINKTTKAKREGGSEKNKWFERKTGSHYDRTPCSAASFVTARFRIVFISSW